jgi:L-threonylcarbamoyladenylate synthase
LILRPGGVTEEDLKNAVKRWSKPVEIARAQKSRQSPGHLEHHYMPEIPLIITATTTDLSSPATVRELKDKLGTAPSRPAELILDEEPEIAARELYTELRRLSATGADALFVRRSPEKMNGFWDAIWDRLTRAASAEVQ